MRLNHKETLKRSVFQCEENIRIKEEFEESENKS